MSKTYLEPAGDHILAIDLIQATTIDGIELPDNQKQQEMVYGTVLFIGPDVTVRTKPQDQICYGPYAGKKVVLEGVEFRIIVEGQIEGYIRKCD